MSKGKNIKKNKVFEYNPELDLKPGRHICECLARKHGLIRNCLSCGRIVCTQEGSGPCFTCGTLVCSKEEQEVLDRGSKKSQKLLEELMSKEGAPTLKDIAGGGGLNQAIDYRNKLLRADVDLVKRTNVNDLQSDYLNMESNPYLTPQERETILERKAELRQMRMSNKQRIVVDFNFSEGKISEQTEQLFEVANDPVLQSIIQQSEARMKSEKEKAQYEFPKNKLSADLFKPEYDKNSSSAPKTSTIIETPLIDFLFGEDDEAFYAEIEQKGYCLALKQPIASLVMSGLRKHVQISDDVRFTGPMLISATTEMMDANETKHEEEFARKRLKNAEITFPTIYQTGVVLGRVFVKDCITWKEYEEMYRKDELEFTPKEGFVLIFNQPEPLSNPIPHIPPNEFYQVNANLRKTVKTMLDPYFVG